MLGTRVLHPGRTAFHYSHVSTNLWVQIKNGEYKNALFSKSLYYWKVDFGTIIYIDRCNRWFGITLCYLYCCFPYCIFIGKESAILVVFQNPELNSDDNPRVLLRAPNHLNFNFCDANVSPFQEAKSQESSLGYSDSQASGTSQLTSQASSAGIYDYCHSIWHTCQFIKNLG